MIINHVIWEDISHTFIEIPKSKDGKNIALCNLKNIQVNLSLKSCMSG
jgi:hypothetical protein